MKTRILILALVLVLSLVVVGLALAQGGNAELPRWALGGGASDSTAAGVALRATLGQPVVGSVSGGGFALGQGFWGGARPGYDIYLPLVIRG